MNEVKYLELGYKEIAEKAKQDCIVFVPLGAIQAHGSALPVGTDVFIPEELCVFAAEKAGGLVSPPLFLSYIEKKYCLPGTLSVPAELAERNIFCMLDSLCDQGFSRFVLVNGHDENEFSMNIACEKLLKKRDARIFAFNWWDIAWDQVSDFMESKFEELGVAGEDETAIIQYMERIRGTIPKDNLQQSPKYRLYGLKTEKLEVFGRPQAASKEKGKKLMETIGSAIAEKVVELI